MFGVANQLLASTALCVGTTVILRDAKDKRHALVTLLPLAFVSTTTLTAGVKAITTLYLPMVSRPETATIGRVNLFVTGTLLVCVALVIVGSVRRWIMLLGQRKAAEVGAA
jgi:carbon starvation protein